MKQQIDVAISRKKPAEETSDALVLFVAEGDYAFSNDFRELDSRMKQALSNVLNEEHFRAKPGETILFHTSNSVVPRRVILSGLGKLQDVTDEFFRRAAAAAAIVARKAGCSRVSFSVPSEESKVEGYKLARAIAEGVILGVYRYVKFKTKEEEIEARKKIESVLLHVSESDRVKKAIAKAILFSEAACFARDLVNEPANILNPETLAEHARQVAAESGLEAKVLEAPELEELGAGAILGVGKGSRVPPRLIQLLYRSEKQNAPTIALVGKGITFDSGGLSLKTAKNMETMKCDMAGAAAVLSTMRALSRLKPDKNVLGILCAAENMPSGTATRPGDILHAMNGKTIEVINTDAEGRLVLADGLAWAARQNVDEIIDLATLTGACVIGLGPYVAGVMGNHRDLALRVIEAGRRAGEPLWELPIPNEYEFMVKSDIADIKNLAQNSEAGAIQGALFLREFVGDKKWVHLDIAGPAFLEKEFFYNPKNATGFGVRTLLQYLSGEEE